jgi:hypothetical protein
MEKEGRMPFEMVKFEDIDSLRHPFVCGYNRAEFMAWAATNPIKHPSFKSEEKRRGRMTFKKHQSRHGDRNDDVYNIQANRKGPPFVYIGLAADIILFCRNGLLSRHKFSSQE